MGWLWSARAASPDHGAHGVGSLDAMSNPAATFEPYRRRLLGLAYRMLGSIADAEDAAFEIEGDVIRALYVVRNSDKLRHLATATDALCAIVRFTDSIRGGARCHRRSRRGNTSRSPHMS